MAQKLSMFISSTVDDLGPVRQAIGDYFEERELRVLLSEDPDFDVRPGLHSHDVCLDNVRDAEVFVLLLGSRYGGSYMDQAKSITWREWEEAHSHNSITILLVQEDAWRLAREISQSRKALQEKHRNLTAPELDAKLLKQYPDARPLRHNIPGVQRFIDALRKGHSDNWIHTWDGTAEGAVRIIERRLSTALGEYHRRSRSELAAQRKPDARFRTLAQLIKHFETLHARVASRRLTQRRAQQQLLQFATDLRFQLFGYRPTDRYNFCVYTLVGNVLRPGPRTVHPEIRVHDQSWPIEYGFIGAPIRTGKIIVSGDVRAEQSWVKSNVRDQDDSRNYVSAVALPLLRLGTRDAIGVLVMTSDRLDHFVRVGQDDVIATRAVGDLLESLMRVEGPDVSAVPTLWHSILEQISWLNSTAKSGDWYDEDLRDFYRLKDEVLRIIVEDKPDGMTSSLFLIPYLRRCDRCRAQAEHQLALGVASSLDSALKDIPECEDDAFDPQRSTVEVSVSLLESSYSFHAPLRLVQTWKVDIEALPRKTWVPSNEFRRRQFYAVRDEIHELLKVVRRAERA